MLNFSHIRAYQHDAIAFIIDNPFSHNWLSMGGGKASICLTAYGILLNLEEVHNILIVAPKNVVNSVWHNEAKDWEHLQHLSFSLIKGNAKQRGKAVNTKAQFHVISKDNIVWLIENYPNKWDGLIVDESSTFKSHNSKRFLALKTWNFDYVTLLSGTPRPQSNADLWSQYYLLDGGRRLGSNITAFRREFQTPHPYVKFQYVDRFDASEDILEVIQDITFNQTLTVNLPEMVMRYVKLELFKKNIAQYDVLERDSIIELDGGAEIVASTGASKTNKLLQFCSGAMYDNEQTTHIVHDVKLKWLSSFINDTDENILIAYNYKFEKEAILSISDVVFFDGSDKMVKDWNAKKIKAMVTHPLSSGHGLNLQYGGNILVWYGFTWNLESYQQLNKRLHRSGQKNIVNVYHLSVGKVENQLMRRLDEKGMKQDNMLEMVKK